jgi:hypothetical protein
MGAKAKKTQKTDPEQRNEEIERLLAEYSSLKDSRDAIDSMLEVRKERLLMLMSETGLGRYAGQSAVASFTRRRSFKVHDSNRLSELLSVGQLAALAKVTADVYDACEREGVAIDEAVTVGHGESLTVARSRTKEEKERRKAHIEESKRQAEKRIQSAIKLLRS